MSAKVSQLIDHYVKSLRKEGWFESYAVEQALRRVQRHRLIERVYRGKSDVIEVDPDSPEHLEMIYSDRALVTRPFPAASSSSQPGLVAMMLEMLELQPGMRVLEIGAGTGYNAALMAELVSDHSSITTMDIQQDVVEQTRRNLALTGYGAIHVLAQDGFYGYPDHAPYDRIVATVGCSDLSPHWLAQLASEGFMLIPLAHGDPSNCPLVRVRQERGQVRGRVVGYSGFMPTRGEFASDLWLPEDKMRKVVDVIKDGEPEAEYPLFQGFEQLADLTPRIRGKWGVRLEFLYFLALNAQQTFSCWKGLVLGDEESFVLLGDDSIQLYGEQATPLFHELKRIYQSWEALGKPRMIDYELEFLALSEASKGKPASEPNAWVINRKFFRQFVRLDA
jgi:protein-L-isoaspartate(D-aspartate) O-methyltransferase